MCMLMIADIKTFLSMSLAIQEMFHQKFEDFIHKKYVENRGPLK